MRIGNCTFTMSALALGLATLATPVVQGQPLFDRVDVTLPYSVTIGKMTLQPGSYKIEQLRSPSGSSQVLLIYGDNGMKFETSALTIPALGKMAETQTSTRVMLHHFGDDYYFDKVWIQGKDYGYEFPLPDSVKSREKEAMQPVSVAANYSSVPAAAAQTDTTATATVAQTDTTTQVVQQDQTVQQAPPVQATPPPVTDQNTANRDETPVATPVPDTTPAPADTSMPHTSSGWAMLLAGGLGLSLAGLSLRQPSRIRNTES